MYLMSTLHKLLRLLQGYSESDIQMGYIKWFNKNILTKWNIQCIHISPHLYLGGGGGPIQIKIYNTTDNIISHLRVCIVLCKNTYAYVYPSMMRTISEQIKK
uniref:Uncharacterized protein n=1 Tax=Pyrrhoderma lamaoense TaxID=2282106 RepID=A0A5B9RB09_9AGAM|nr:hypothetical protein PLAO_000055 [Phellinus lamaoensis]QEG57136.1 hypothetical protein PLAO_000055 [Phellinus lamaoensis]